MRSRPATPSQKFFRRTSRSPWQVSKPSQPIENQYKTQQSPNHPHISINTKSPAINSQTKPSPTYLSYLQNHMNFENSTINKITNSTIGTEQKYPTNSLHQKDPNQMKFTYIHIQSVGNIDSIPTIRRRGTQNFTNGSQTKRQQQLTLLQKAIQKLRQEYKSLLQENTTKTQQIIKFTQQIDKLRNTNDRLQNQIKELKINLTDTEIQLKNMRVSNENMKNKLEVSQSERYKQQEKTKEIGTKMKKIQQQLKWQKDENNILNQLVQTKQKQLKNLKVEQPPAMRGSRVGCSSGRQNIPIQLRSTARSISINQTVRTEKRDSMLIKFKESPPKQEHTCNRFIQTDSCSLETALKEIQKLKQNAAKEKKQADCMKIQRQEWQIRLKIMDDLTNKLQEYQKLIQKLNEKLIEHETQKLSIKFKYY